MSVKAYYLNPQGTLQKDPSGGLLERTEETEGKRATCPRAEHGSFTLPDDVRCLAAF